MHRPAISSAWILVTTLLLVVALIPFDPTLSERAQGLPETIVVFNQRITDFGTFGWMIYASAFLLLTTFMARRASRHETVRQRMLIARDLFAYFLVTIAAASALVHGLKFLIGRPRPQIFDDHGAYDLMPFAGDRLFESFPSGHSTAAGALFGALAMLTPQLRPVFLLMALTIGISRVIVGAHYPSDVAAGLLLGLWSAVAAAFLFARQDWLFGIEANGWPALKFFGHRQVNEQEAGAGVGSERPTARPPPA